MNNGPRRPRQTPNNRNRELGRIHVAAKQLKLDDGTYRAMLERVAGVRSAKDLDDAGRGAVIRELVRLGARDSKRSRHHPGCPKNVKDKPLLRKCEALLADANRPWSYAHGLATRMFSVKRVEWLRDDQLHKLVSALQVDANRKKKRQ